MSSAILYLAIVAIWAVVLVPRWLHPRAAPPQPVRVPAESPDAELREPASPGQDAGAAQAEGTDGPDAAGEPVADSGVSGTEARDEETEIAAPSTALRRTDMLKARRRLLTTLITLTGIALGLAVTGIEAYWIVIPPTVLLAGYAVLLRQFAHIDAERAHRATRIRLAEARARAGQEPTPAATPAVGEPDLGSGVPAAPGDAEIIDISGRIVDQVYDQYSDEANRAVGD